MCRRAAPGWNRWPGRRPMAWMQLLQNQRSGRRLEDVVAEVAHTRPWGSCCPHHPHSWVAGQPGAEHWQAIAARMSLRVRGGQVVLAGMVTADGVGWEVTVSAFAVCRRQANVVGLYPFSGQIARRRVSHSESGPVSIRSHHHHQRRPGRCLHPNRRPRRATSSKHSGSSLPSSGSYSRH